MAQFLLQNKEGLNLKFSVHCLNFECLMCPYVFYTHKTTQNFIKWIFKKNEHYINLERSPSSLIRKAWSIEFGGSSSTHDCWNRNFAIKGLEDCEVESLSELSPF